MPGSVNLNRRRNLWWAEGEGDDFPLPSLSLSLPLLALTATLGSHRGEELVRAPKRKNYIDKTEAENEEKKTKRKDENGCSENEEEKPK